ncbi:hypothetical protein BKA70DRAFT_1147429 [Coprinopsis sp. MPI-PUGE-AT-0042]|nr:hypothetical protein BKA70DRAFT_1147429 [Coprinopsis sp. MPI-PUGE-AT-0042]
MAPVRTKDNVKEGEPSTSKRKGKQGPGKKLHHHQPKATAIPGKQKIKGALRQARRLLAKDKLAADKRVETERRIKALEAELEQAEHAEKERAMAVRYHKVKFFERKKVTRKLTQIKKRMQSAEGSEKEELAAQLLEERVNLNYILHYPKAKKYISLFPPEVRNGEAPAKVSEAESDKTNKDREEVRSWVRESMMKKDLPSEPELQIDAPHTFKTQFPSQAKSKSASSSKAQKKETANDIADDDFFDNDSDEESEEDED